MGIQATISAYMKAGHLFPSEAVAVELSGAQAWVIERETGRGIKLFASESAARAAIAKAVRAYEARA